MDRKTLLAVVLSVIVITIGFTIQTVLFPPEPQTEVANNGSVVEPTTSSETTDSKPVAEVSVSTGGVSAVNESITRNDEILLKTGVFEAVFTNRGGIPTSLKLLEHLDGDGFVEMINRGESGEVPSDAFQVYFGNHTADALDVLFNVRRPNSRTVEFYRDFTISGSTFRMIKRYEFQPDEYLFELTITFENTVNEYLPLNFDNISYTVGFGPQIGPSFTQLDGRTEYRRYYTYLDGKRKEIKLKKGELEEIPDRVSWAAIAGKYFTFIAIPVATDYSVIFSTESTSGLKDSSSLYISRPVIKSSKNEDTYRFYVGPKTDRILAQYNDVEKNGFGISNLKLDEAVDSNPVLGWLENLLKMAMRLFYRLIPNWGVSIILLTILVKALLFPLTHKSYESTSKMQALAPKLEELKTKYKDNPQKLNQETAEFYRKEGVNPMGGCLPMLLQIPIFFAMYGLFNKHFDLRGAVFIEGWISDLSAPESILSFGGFSVPLLNWTDLRLLPFIFVGTQLASTRLTQNPGTQTNNQMKMMTTLMPVMFFFIMYNMPSGLLVYWIMTNIITTGQQLFINKFMKKKA